MNGDDQDWTSRFKTATRSAPTGAHSATLAVPSSSFARANFESQYGGNPTSGPSAVPGRTNATSRIIPAPSNTNWNSTFVQNTPSSPSNTDWQKTFGSTNSFASNSAVRNPQSAIQKPFSFDLSPSTDRPQLSLPTSDFQDRAANLDLTSRDHELYGAGSDYGFTY